jgi:hypothetical protein
MASFPAINRFSFGQPASIRPEISNLGEDNVPAARDVRDAVGFSNCEDLGLIAFQPRTTDSGKVTLQVLPSQLLSQGFQETLRSLTSAGVPAQIVALAEQTLSPDKAAVAELKTSDGSKEFGQSNLERDYGYVAGPPSSSNKAVLENADWYKDEPYHQAPSYGSD